MPSSKGYKRDYKQEYKTQGASTAQKKARARRNKDRAKMAKKKGVKPTSLKGDVDHKRKNARGKTTLKTVKANRSHGGKIGNRAGKARGGRIGKRK